MYAHLTEPRPKVSAFVSAAAEFDHIIARALAKDPDDRCPSAGDLGCAATAACESRPVPPRTERTVAAGDAAPVDASTRISREQDKTVRPSVTDGANGGSRFEPTGTRVHRRGRLLASGSLALLIAGAIVAALLSGVFAQSGERTNNSPATTPPTAKPRLYAWNAR